MNETPRQIDLTRAPENLGPRLAVIGAVVLVGFAIAAMVLELPVMAVAGALGGIGFTAMAFANPFAGLIGYMAWEYIRPQESIPALIPLHLQRVIAIVILLAWLRTRLVKKPIPFVSSPQNRSMVFFWLMMLFSVATAFYRAQAYNFAIDFAKSVIVYFLIINLVNSQRRLAIFVWTLVLLNAYIAFGTMKSFMTGATVSSEGIARAMGTSVFLSDPNDVATALSAALPFMVLLFPALKRGSAKFLFAVIGAAGIVAITFTGSRGGTIALAAVVFMLWFRSQRKVATGLTMVVLMGMFWVVAPSGYRERVISIKNYQTEATAVARREAWRAGVQLFIHRPLLGVGGGNFGAARASSVGKAGFQDWQTAHSIYFQLLAEVGIFGTLGFAWIFLGVFRDTRATRRRVGDRAGGEYATRVTYAVEASLIGMLSGGLFLSLAYFPILYFLPAIAVAQRRIAEDEFETAEEMEEKPAVLVPTIEPIPGARPWRG